MEEDTLKKVKKQELYKIVSYNFMNDTFLTKTNGSGL